MANVLAVVLMALIFSSCSDEKSGKSLNAPQVEPPVAEATPAGLKSGASSLALSREFKEDVPCDDGDSDCFENRALSRLVLRIFKGKEGCNGSAPDDIEGRVRCNLYNIDSRMISLDKRAQESERKCQSEASKDFVFKFPAGQTRTAKFQCAENLSVPDGTEGSSHLGFGIDGNDFYLVETQSTGKVVYTHANTASNDYEVFIGGNKTILGDLEGDTSDGKSTGGVAAHEGLFAIDLIHIKANSEAKSFEIAVGANHAIGNGVSCGVQLKSNGTYVYAKGIFAELENTELQTACNNTEDALDICLDASTFEKVAASNCADINTFTVSAITPTSFAQTDKAVYGDFSYSDLVTGFNVDAAE